MNIKINFLELLVSAKEAHINAQKMGCQPLFGFDSIYFHLTKFNSEIINMK